MFPIKYIDNNLVWNKDNEVFAYYERSNRESAYSMMPCAVCMLIVISIRMPIPLCGLVSERLGDILLLMGPLTIIIPP